MFKGLLVAILGTIVLIVTAVVAYSYARTMHAVVNISNESGISHSPAPASQEDSNTTGTAIVTEILNDSFIVASGESEMTLSKDPSIVQVFRRDRLGTSVSGYESLKAGQTVTVHVVVPGQQVEVFIEE